MKKGKTITLIYYDEYSPLTTYCDAWKHEGSRSVSTRFTDIIPEMLRVVTDYKPGTGKITVNKVVR